MDLLRVSCFILTIAPITFWQILPQFDLNNLSVASKLGKLEKTPKNTLKKAHGPHKGLPIWGRPVDNSTNQFLEKFYPQFDLNNLSVASKLGKLEKRPKKNLKKVHGPPKG